MALPTSPVATLTGSGITPSGALGAQLAALTRRAFLPSVYVQIYQSHPLLSLFMSNAKAARGGVSQITVPVQGSSPLDSGQHCTVTACSPSEARRGRPTLRRWPRSTA